ncbi:MAG: hypothetical protein ACLSVD_04925 [Eggerthellaceae bacterium]
MKKSTFETCSSDWSSSSCWPWCCCAATAGRARRDHQKSRHSAYRGGASWASNSRKLSYSYAFEAVDEHESARDAALVFGTFFVNTIAFSSAGTIVVDDARCRGIAPARHMSAALLSRSPWTGRHHQLIAFGILAATVGCRPCGFWGCCYSAGQRDGAYPCWTQASARPAPASSTVVDRALKKALDPGSSASWARFPTPPALSRITPRQRRGVRLLHCGQRRELACSAWWAWRSARISPNLICVLRSRHVVRRDLYHAAGRGVVEAAVVVAFTSFGVSGAAGRLSRSCTAASCPDAVPHRPILIQTTKTFKHDAKRAARPERQGLRVKPARHPFGASSLPRTSMVN